MRKELVLFIGLIAVFMSSILFAGDLIIVDNYEDRRGTFSCGYLKSTIERKGAIVNVQVDRIHPTGTVRSWVEINCKTKEIYTGKIKDFKTDRTFNLGYKYCYDCESSKADGCDAKVIDSICK